ncbi:MULTISPECIES: TIGR00304 family membrane protein [Metallosphaera]|uniref:TIGR00304 family membrane protein n=2 Tax=Sulfolobaceae TaxID=118883 RepID=UPI001F06374A|nr:DUF131 domain-containing protein [Metallosphaera sedula]MCH1770534.1 DUF131 domain-containing protein [Metallosphaera sedula]MCP6728732.1 DUF131 domain-containing protein [Metallosphaera sedula]
MRLTIAGIILIFAGFILLFASAFSSTQPSNTTVGGVVLIGPVPIIFGKGYSSELVPLMIIGVIFTIIAIIFFFGSILLFRRPRSET